jgi:hypothetical protein
MPCVKRGIAIPHELHAVIQEYAMKCDVSVNHVIVRMLQVARLHIITAEGVGYPADCAHVSQQVPRLSEITHGKFLLSRRRLVKLLGLPTARHSRFRTLVRNGAVEIQQSGFAGHSKHHEKLVRIRRDVAFTR